jgi:hypothetical protein
MTLASCNRRSEDVRAGLSLSGLLRGVSTFSDHLIVLAIFLLLDFLTLLARVVGVEGDALGSAARSGR